MIVNLVDRFYYKIQVGDSFDSLSLKFNTSKENILRNNMEIPLYVGEVVVIKQNEFITHFVSPIETIKDISNKYNVDEQKIVEDNDLQTKKLYIGQKLKIKKEKC